MLRRHNECLRQVSSFVWAVVAVCASAGVYARAVIGRRPSECVWMLAMNVMSKALPEGVFGA